MAARKKPPALSAAEQVAAQLYRSDHDPPRECNGTDVAYMTRMRYSLLGDAISLTLLTKVGQWALGEDGVRWTRVQ